jgi:hypothetical protein
LAARSAAWVRHPAAGQVLARHLGHGLHHVGGRGGGGGGGHGGQQVAVDRCGQRLLGVVLVFISVRSWPSGPGRAMVVPMAVSATQQPSVNAAGFSQRKPACTAAREHPQCLHEPRNDDETRRRCPQLDLPKRAVALVLAGGRGSRLKNLTDNRAKPAVYFGGKFRIVDFALSNCMNSGIRRIGVITQYKSHSLLRHLQRGWAFLKSEMNEFVDLLPAQQRVDEESWYRGTADAVYQNQDILAATAPTTWWCWPATTSTR